MIDEEDINFIKVFLIIMKGGTMLCRKLVLALVISSKNGNSLENILQEHRQAQTTETWVYKHLTKEQFEKLFPRNNQAIDINQWDISLLTFVLLNVFNGSLNSPVKAAVKTLRDKRNNIIGHGSDSKIKKDAFVSIWTHVTLAMSQLSRMLTSDDQMEYLSMESTIFAHPFQTATIKDLEEIGLTETFAQSIIGHIMPKIKEEIGKEDVLRRLEKLEKAEDIHKTQIALLVKMFVHTDSARSKGQVQEHLLEASSNIISKDPDANIFGDGVESAVEELFKVFEEQGVKVKKADKGSVLLTILCPTIKCLRDILVYINSPQIKDKLTHIEKAVDKYYACETRIGVDIDLHSLETTINRLEEELDAGAIYLTLECSGTWGVKNAFQMFENGESTNTLNKLSEALSRKVGEKVELHTSIDKDKLEDDIEKEIERKDEDERKIREEKHDYERKKHDAEMMRNVRRQLLEDLEIMRKSDKRCQQLLDEHFKMVTERKEEDERNSRGRDHTQRSIYDAIVLQETIYDLGRLTVEEQLEKMWENIKINKQHLEHLREDKERKLRKEKQDFERKKQDAERTRKVRQQLLEDLDIMRKLENRSQQHFQVFYRRIYEEMWRENKEDIRILTVVQRVVEELHVKMRKNIERSQQLLDNLCESNMPGVVFFTQLKENEAVIRRLNKALVKTRDGQELLRQRAIHRQSRRQQNAKEAKRMIEIYRRVHKALRQMRLSNENSRQLLRELDTPGYEFSTKVQAQIDENEAVIRRVKEALDKSILLDEQVQLRERATDEQRQRQIYTQIAGAAVGGAIGLAGGPVGMVIGGAIGLFVGGLFGRRD